MNLSYTEATKNLTTVHAGKIRIGEIKENPSGDFTADFYSKRIKVVCPTYEDAKKFMDSKYQEYGIEKFTKFW